MKIKVYHEDDAKDKKKKKREKAMGSLESQGFIRLEFMCLVSCVKK